MDKLIEALQIFRKYGNPDYPTHCEHDIMHVCIDPEIVSDEDKEKLGRLGFEAGHSDMPDGFYSYKFGSA